MAVTFTNVKTITAGNETRVVGTCTGPASYTTGGETLSAAQIGQLTGTIAGPRSTTSLATVVQFDSEVEPANLRSLVLDRTNLKMLFTVAGAQVANATNLSAVSVNFEAITQIVP